MDAKCNYIQSENSRFWSRWCVPSGGDKEFEITRTLALSGWNSLEIPLSEFTGLTTKSRMLHNSFSGSAGTIYIDNVYFNKVAIVAPASCSLCTCYIRNRRIWILGF
jgi:hypothetical protein